MVPREQPSKNKRTVRPAMPKAKTRPPGRSAAGSRAPEAQPQPDLAREAMIAEAAYYLAMARGFAPGHEVEDWLAAEAQVDGRKGKPAR